MYRRDKSPTSTGSEGVSYSSRRQNNQCRRNRAYSCVTHALGDHETQLPDSSPTPNSFQHQTSANHSPSSPHRSPTAPQNPPKSVTCTPGPAIRNSRRAGTAGERVKLPYITSVWPLRFPSPPAFHTPSNNRRDARTAAAYSSSAKARDEKSLRSCNSGNANCAAVCSHRHRHHCATKLILCA